MAYTKMTAIVSVWSHYSWQQMLRQYSAIGCHGLLDGTEISDLLFDTKLEMTKD